MTKTLADMTAEEREACVGMWCNFIDFDDSNGYEFQTGSLCPQLGIVIRLPEFDDEFEVIVPASGCEQVYVPERDITPRFDLPRAWNPDGTPVKGEWVDGHMWWNEPGDDSQPVDLIGAECLGTGEMQGMGKWPENVTPAVSDEDMQVRRFITEWENTNV